MTNPTELKKLISERKINECFEILFSQIEIVRKTGKNDVTLYFDALISLKGQFVENEQNKIDGITNNYSSEKNKIAKNLTNFINQLPKEYYKIKSDITIKAKASLRELIALDDKKDKYTHDVFVSFSHKDEDDVRIIANTLRGYGLRVFIYFETIAANAGGNFLTKIDEALRNSRHFILIATPHSLSSDTVKMEYENFHMFVHQKDKKNRKFIIFEGNNFNEDALPLIFRNTDRVNKPEDLITGLIDVKYLNKKYDEKLQLAKEEDKNKIIKLQQEIKKLENKLHTISVESKFSYKLIEDAKKSGYEQAKNEIDTLKNELKTAKQELSAIENQLKTSNTDEKVKNLNADLENKNKQISKLQTQLKQIEAEDNKKNTRIKTLNGKITSLEKDLFSLKQQLKSNNFAPQIDKLKAEIENKKRELSKIISENKKLKDEIIQLKKEAIKNEELTKKAVKEKNEKIDSLRNKLTTTENTLIKTKNTLSEKEKDYTELNKKFTLINQDINSKIKKETTKKLSIILPIVFVLFIIILFVWSPWEKNEIIKDSAQALKGINRDSVFGKEILYVESKVDYTEEVNNTSFEMVFVHGGTFQMGSDDGSSNEKPIHPVTVSDFYISKYEVTFEEYDAFCDTTNRDKPDDKGWGRGDRPVINVSWNDAVAYCKWLSNETGKNYRLPTEAEWEYAANGGVETNGRAYQYAGSNNIDDVAWYWDNSGSKTHPVGTKLPNSLGIYDMSGNVWEWCEDWYKSYPNSSHEFDYTGSRRVVRGGSWSYNASSCRVADRNFSTPSGSSYNLGFRVCQED